MTSPGSMHSNCRFIDIHYHANPCLYQRRLSALEAGRRYQALEGAVVLKSHLGSTGIQATLAQDLGLPVFPSLVLNAIAGGIDYRVIVQALSEYQSDAAIKMLVHFPTLTGRQYQSRLARQLIHPQLTQHTLKAATLFNEGNQLRKEAVDILKMAADFPIVLSTGHASKEEVDALIDACIRYNVPKLLLNQPANPLTGLDADALKTIAQQPFVYIEQTALTYLLGHQSKDDFDAVMSTLPRVIYSSDLGQTSQIEIERWVQDSNAHFDALQLTPERKDALWKSNAMALLTE